MDFLLSALGSAGDVHPFIAIAQALQARGHRACIVTSPYFEARIRRAGVPFAPLGAASDYERLLQRAELWDARRGAGFILDELMARLPEAYAVTDALVGPRTVVVGSTLSWGARLVQERRGIRGATIHLSPVCLPSAIAPPVLPGVGDLSWMPAPVLRFLQRAGERLLLDRAIGPRLNLIRAALGLPPVDRICSRWMHSPDLVVGAWPDWFAAPRADWPPQARTSGFPVFDEGGAALPPSLAAFLASGTAPVGVTPGSAMAHGERFFARALAACAALGRRAVLVTPFRDQLPTQLPAWAHHVAYTPFSALLPRLCGLVHHGGIGTSAQALAAALPQVVVPFAHDQFDNAARLRRLGVATTVAANAPEGAWLQALRTALDAPSPAVDRCAERMRAGGSAADDIARLLEGMDPRAASDRGRPDVPGARPTLARFGPRVAS